MTMQSVGGQLLGAFTALAAALAGSSDVLAAEGAPRDWQLGLQVAASPIAEQMHDFHNFLLIVITAITVFVLCLLVWVMVRYNRRANPEPSKTHHNTLLEVTWTVVPILILIAIAIPSFRLLYAQYSFPKPDLTIKAIGSQWYWSYEYPDQGFNFDSLMLEKSDLKEGQPYLLAVDNEVFVPVGKVVQVLVTANDVIHSWTVPAFGSKIDAVPGRVTRTWFKVTEPGIYYGQCSELCGDRHAFMPIAVRAVSQEEFDAWVEKMRGAYASNDVQPAALTKAEPPLTKMVARSAQAAAE